MYNTVKDIHIAIDIGLQQISSNRKRSFVPQEIDHIFNDNMLKYIANNVTPYLSIYGKGFEDDNNKLDNIQSLVRKSKDLCYVSDTGYKCIFPNNINNLTGLRVNVIDSCYGSVKEESVDTTYVSILPFTDITSGTYDDLIISVKDILGAGTLLYNNSLYGITTVNSQSKLLFIDNVLNVINNNTTYKIYWEYYGNVYNRDSFILVTKTKDLLYTNISYNSNSTHCNFTKSDNTYYTSSTYSNVKLIALKSGSGFIDNYYFKKNLRKHPICEIYNNEVVIPNDDTFTPNSVEFTYIKKPIFINSDANIMTDFKDNIDEIIRLTVSDMSIIISGNVQAIQTNLKNSE